MGILNKLSHLEQWAQRVVEGSLGRLLGGDFGVADVVAACQQALEAQPTDQPTPTAYLIALHPDDWATVQAANPPWQGDIEAAIVAHAATLGRRMTTRPQVEFLVDTTLARHAPQVRVGQARAVAVATDVFDAAGPAPDEVLKALYALDAFVVVDGQTHVPLRRPLLSLGRHVDNDIVVNRPTVSRYHGQIRWRFGRFILYDLGSRGGTQVNGQRVSECILHDGDVITLSDASLLYAEGQTRSRSTLPEAGQTRVMPAVSDSRPSDEL
jgi:hypothetical protein